MLSIADITITPELYVRPSHQPDLTAETAAIRRLSDIIHTEPDKTFEFCADLALELCGADTCGISLLERDETGADIFRWIALSGTLKEHLRGTTPRFYSPCGICVDTATPLLMRRPELVYTYLDVGPPIHDALLIPMNDPERHLEGTIWIITHDPERRFDLEHARLIQRMAVFTASALHLLDPEVRNTVPQPLPAKIPDKIKDQVARTLREPVVPVPEQPAGFRTEIEVRSHAELRAQMRSMREWLDHRHVEPTTFRYSSGPRGYILRVEFIVEADAAAFATAFKGRVH